MFLSSFTVQGDRAAIPPDQLIPYAHAQAEMSLEKVFGQDYVAVRAGTFATNALGWKNRIANSTGEIMTLRPDVYFDFITPVDMGIVAASLLVNGKKGSETSVNIFGPEQVAQRDAMSVVATVMGKPDSKVVKAGPEDRSTVIKQDMAHVPEQIANHLVSMLDQIPDGPQPFDQSWVDNVQKYGGRPPTTFKSWVEDSKALFLA